MVSSQLALEGKGLRYKLLVIQALVFVLPFLVLFYLFYQNRILFNTNQLVLLALILVLIFAGLVILRQVFEKVFAFSSLFKRSLTGEHEIVGQQEDIDELHEMTVSLNQLMERFKDTNDELQQRVYEILSIKELIEAARSSLDIEELLERLLEKAIAVSGAQIGSVLMVEPDKQRFRVVATKGLDSGPEKNSYINIKDALSRLVLTNKEPLLVEDIEKDLRTQKSNDSRYGSPSFLSIPLFVHEDIAAVLNLASKQTKANFNLNDKQILSIMIDEIGLPLKTPFFIPALRISSIAFGKKQRISPAQTTD